MTDKTDGIPPQQHGAERRLDGRRDGFAQVSYHKAYIENAPFDDNGIDVVISNGVINLCPDKKRVFQEVLRVLRPGGRLQFADIANGKPVPASAMRDIDLWTA